jgi:hypothetical protein
MKIAQTSSAMHIAQRCLFGMLVGTLLGGATSHVAATWRTQEDSSICRPRVSLYHQYVDFGDFPVDWMPYSPTLGTFNGYPTNEWQTSNAELDCPLVDEGATARHHTATAVTVHVSDCSTTSQTQVQNCVHNGGSITSSSCTGWYGTGDAFTGITTLSPDVVPWTTAGHETWYAEVHVSLGPRGTNSLTGVCTGGSPVTSLFGFTASGT